VKSILFAPDSKLRTIGKGAFRGCALETIHLPSSVKGVDDGAFEKCVQLKSVLIKVDPKYQKISPSAFEGCSNLEIYPSVGIESTG